MRIANVNCRPATAMVCAAVAAIAMGTLAAAVVAAPPPDDGALRRDFAQPPLQWKSRPLWFWNGPLDEDTTTAIMEKSVGSGYYGFGILPTKDMGVAFMSPEFLRHYRHAVDTAARLGLKMCLYDEFWFPSGGAGGLLKERYPEALSRRLDIVETSLDGPAPASLDIPAGHLMAAVAMHRQTKERVDLSAHVRNHRLVWQAPAGPWQVMLLVCVPDGARDLVDYLDPESVRKFVSLTYEKYYATFPEHFGKTVDSAFYDEPTFHWVQGGRAWTPAFNQRFQEKFGKSPALYYPALWYDIGAETAAARNAMFGLRAEMFADGFVKVLADWCQAHGIQLTGHVDQEEIANPVGLCGDLIKVFEHQPVPGLDQIFQYGRGSPMYKVVSSAAVNYGRPLVMTECYGGMKLPLPNLYREAMDQFAKGVNLMVPHAVWYRTNPITFPPELSFRTEPYAAELPRYNEYIGRLQRVLQQGRPIVDIAVLYPIHGLQAAYHFGPGQPYTGGVIPEWADYMQVGERLSLDLRHDFTYLHPETLDARCQLAGCFLRLQQPAFPQEYRLIILPGMEAISASNLAKVKTFFDQGGQVVATSRLPDQSAEFGKGDQVRAMTLHIFGHEAVVASSRRSAHPEAGASSVAGAASHAAPPSEPGRVFASRGAGGGRAWFIENPTAAALRETVEQALPQPDVAWLGPPTVAGGHLTYLHKEIAGRHFWFFANSSDTPVNTTVRLRGAHILERWDPHTGQVGPQAGTTSPLGTEVGLQLGSVSSIFLVSKP